MPSCATRAVAGGPSRAATRQRGEVVESIGEAHRGTAGEERHARSSSSASDISSCAGTPRLPATPAPRTGPAGGSGEARQPDRHRGGRRSDRRACGLGGCPCTQVVKLRPAHALRRNRDGRDAGARTAIPTAARWTGLRSVVTTPEAREQRGQHRTEVTAEELEAGQVLDRHASRSSQSVAGHICSKRKPASRNMVTVTPAVLGMWRKSTGDASGDRVERRCRGGPPDQARSTDSRAPFVSWRRRSTSATRRARVAAALEPWFRVTNGHVEPASERREELGMGVLQLHEFLVEVEIELGERRRAHVPRFVHGPPRTSDDVRRRFEKRPPEALVGFEVTTLGPFVPRVARRRAGSPGRRLSLGRPRSRASTVQLRIVAETASTPPSGRRGVLSHPGITHGNRFQSGEGRLEKKPATSMYRNRALPRWLSATCCCRTFSYTPCGTNSAAASAP